MKILIIHHHRRKKIRNMRPEFFSGRLVRRGHEVTCVCVADTARFSTKTEIKDGALYVESPDLLWGRLRSGWDPWCTFRRWLYLRNQAFDLVHVIDTRPATIYPVLAMLKRHPAPLVTDWIDWWGHGGLAKDNRPAWYPGVAARMETYFEEHFRPLADGTIVISHALGERAAALGVPPETITWIPIGAEVEHYTPVDSQTHRARFGLPADAFIVGDSAADALMGMELSMRAVKKAAERHPNILFLMTGKHQAMLEKLAADTGLGSRFRHMGFLSHSDLKLALSCVDAFILPYENTVSNRGRWPGKIGKYLALGRPVVTNPVGEMKFLLEACPLGKLAAETPEDMARCLCELLENPQQCREMGHQARRYAEENLTWDHMTDRLEACYAGARENWARRRARGMVSCDGCCF